MMNNAPRMRTVPEAYKMLLEADPNTAITLCALRRMVKKGEITPVAVGNKRLINYDAMLDALTNPQAAPEQSQGYGTIRRVG